MQPEVAKKVKPKLIELILQNCYYSLKEGGEKYDNR